MTFASIDYYMQSTIAMMSEWQRLYVVQVLSRTNPVVIVYSDKYVTCKGVALNMSHRMEKPTICMVGSASQ